MSTGILLLTFGSAITADDVPAYLTSVRGGRPVPDDVVAEFRHRYDVIGRSPLIDITRAQASALQQLLDDQEGTDTYRVEVGMLHSEPRIHDALASLVREGVHEVIAVVLAPQYSSIILRGYERALEQASIDHPDVAIRTAGAWHLLPEWIDSLAERVGDATARLSTVERDRVPVIFTAHSLPRAVVDRDPGYITQLKDTARAVAERVALPELRWRFAYQSAGHTPEEWLTPDVKDLLPTLRSSGHDAVLVVPVQFLADHLEILYDLDVAAADEARELGMTMHRIAMPNTSPTFIRALAAVVRRALHADNAVRDTALGRSGHPSRRA